MNRARSVLHIGLALLSAAMLVLLTSPAYAAGSFKLKSSEVSEVSGAWHVFVTIELPKAPSTAHTPMRFLFTKTVVYERSLVDGKSEPVLNRQSVQSATPTVESLDVDFADASGKLFKITRFDFGLTRQRGYEAGEYKVELRNSDGVTIGSPATITLKGDNPAVDRRSIAFNASNKSIKKVGDHDGGVQKVGQNSEDPAPVNNGGDVQAVGSAAPFISPEAYNKTPEEEMKTKPGGCGCDVPGVSDFGVAGFGAIVAGITILAQRRRTAVKSKEARSAR
jgi:hypothetical protein